MAAITEFEGYEVLVLNKADIDKTGMTLFDFLDQTGGMFVSRTDYSKEMLDMIGIHPKGEYYICVLAELVMKVGEKTTTSFMHHEIAHLKLGHVDSSYEIAIAEGRKGGAINILANEIAADAYAASIVGQDRMRKDFRRMFIATLSFMRKEGQVVRRAVRRLFAMNDVAERMKALGGVEGRHFYRAK